LPRSRLRFVAQHMASAWKFASMMSDRESFGIGRSTQRPQKVHSFDNLVARYKQGWRHRKPKRLCSFEIDDHQIFDWHLNRKLRRLCATENAIHIAGSATKYISGVCSVGKQTSVSGDNRGLRDRRHIVPSCQQHHMRAFDFHKIIWHREETASRLAPKRGDGRLGSRIGIEHYCGPLDAGRDLRKQLEPLARE
jgi:hypothetical protein